MEDTEIVQSWDFSVVALSFVISSTGSLCTIQLMEQWRLSTDKKLKSLLLKVSALALGGCGIWAMHFTGMDALVLTAQNGQVLSIHYKGALTIVSFIAPVATMYIGLLIASKDAFFLAIQASERGEILLGKMKNMKMAELMDKKAAKRTLMRKAMASNLQHIAGGGFALACGAMIMHFLGMLAQTSNMKMHLSIPIILLTFVIAVVVASAAFWIIFRVLTFWPRYETLRVGSAMVMGFAVCVIHYTGMYAATYTFSSKVPSTFFVMNGTKSARYASHGALLACYLLCSNLVVRKLRSEAIATANISNMTSIARTSRHANKSYVVPISDEPFVK